MQPLPPALGLVVLAHDLERACLRDFVSALQHCNSVRRTCPGQQRAAPLFVSTASSPAEALMLIQTMRERAPTCALFMSQTFSQPTPNDPFDLPLRVKHQHPSVPVVCWGDSSKVNMTSIKGCHVILDWCAAAGTAPLVAVLKMIEQGEIRPESRLKITKPARYAKPNEDDADDLLLIPVLGLGIPTFYRPGAARQRQQAVDVGDVHIPLTHEHRPQPDRHSTGQRGSGNGKHSWDRLAFFFANESERTKMLLDELRARRERERAGSIGPSPRATRGATRAGPSPQGPSSGGALDRVSASSSVVWNELGREMSGLALHRGGWDEESVSADSYPELAGLISELEQYSAADRSSAPSGPSTSAAPQPSASAAWGAPAQPTQTQLPTPSASATLLMSTTGGPATSGQSHTSQTSRPGGGAGTGAAPQESQSMRAPAPGQQSFPAPGASLAGVSFPVSGTTAQMAALLASNPVGQVSGPASDHERVPDASQSASVGWSSPAVHAGRLAEELRAKKLKFPSSEAVRALMAELEQLRQLVQVKRELQKLSEQAGGKEEKLVRHAGDVQSQHASEEAEGEGQGVGDGAGGIVVL